ncbi:MAG: 5-formyltetrahydrofolate cyclo-ligase [Ruminococcaceae bacterium]|nr:5-formyltetrahydrofolate cyclo-ligase [Oscillospiraceae bacterium]
MKLGLRAEKHRIRQEMLARRLAIPNDIRHRADAAMVSRFVNLASFRFAEVLLLYAPIQGEPSLLAVCETAQKLGKAIAFPKCDPETNTMQYHLVPSIEALRVGAYGILEPEEQADIYHPHPDKHDICVVPAVCYDRNGYRIGYGKGYYDRYLSGFGGTTVGLTMHEFLLPTLPRGRFDRSVDLVITEKGVFTPQ